MDRDFLKLSERLGKDVLLTQAAGGNTSIKEATTLWVKASGKWLAQAAAEDIFVSLDQNAVLAQYLKGRDDFTPFITGANTLRPSIETAFHALLPHRVVIHVHSVNTIAHAVRTDGEQIFGALLGGLPWAWIPYYRPGLPLTQAIECALKENPDVFVLQNHGLIVGAETVAAAEKLLNEVEARVRITPRAAPATSTSVAETRSAAIARGLTPADDAQIDRLATDPISLELSKRGVLYPDHVVFLGSQPPVVEALDRLSEIGAEYEARWRKPAPYFVVPGCGIFFQKAPSPTVREMLRCQSLVLERLAADTPLRTLSNLDLAQLLNWDAEVYRQALER